MTAKELRNKLNEMVTPENENAEVWLFVDGCAPCGGVGFNSLGDLCLSYK